jgi:hypothetical protein
LLAIASMEPMPRRTAAPSLRASVGDLVRSMSCYYSNLIEGHNTLPIDIDRALKDDYAGFTKRRNLQLEARAHLEVQRMIDRGGPRRQ